MTSILRLSVHLEGGRMDGEVNTYELRPGDTLSIQDDGTQADSLRRPAATFEWQAGEELIVRLRQEPP